MDTSDLASGVVACDRPDYVPEKGWFIELDYREATRNRIWHDGKVLPFVQRVSVQVDAQTTVPLADIRIRAPVLCRVQTREEGTTVSTEPLPSTEVAVTPHVCPVCLGSKHVALGFYRANMEGTWSGTDVGYEPCQSCDATGVIWR